MIYLEPSTLGWKPIIRSCISALVDPVKTVEFMSLTEQLLDWLIDPCFDFVKKQCKVTLNYIPNVFILKG